MLKTCQGSVIGWAGSLKKRYVGALTPSPSEYDLIWRQFYRGNKVKMKSLGWVLIQCDWYPYQKGNLG